jgi:peptide/nickel transport system ATP-binding protein
MRVASVGDWTRRTLETIPGQPPFAGEELPGCRFAPRCAYAAPACVASPIPLTDLVGLGAQREVRCVRAESLDRASA